LLSHKPQLVVGSLVSNVHRESYVGMDLDNGPLLTLMLLEPALILSIQLVVVLLPFNVLKDIFVNWLVPFLMLVAFVPNVSFVPKISKIVPMGVL
jgi:hypothetical protein